MAPQNIYGGNFSQRGNYRHYCRKLLLLLPIIVIEATDGTLPTILAYSHNIHNKMCDILTQFSAHMRQVLGIQ